jgi:16S rRNA (uracil1498-N3)-methyltransferase
MSNCRFYSTENLKTGATVKLSDNAAAHATRVLRLEISDEIVLFNGDGNDYICAITSIKKSETLVIVKSFVKITNESPLNITLLQGISSGDRMDYTIQKAVELGVKNIVPINTTRSVVKLTNERAEKRLAHWQSVVHAACEQSGRAFVPTVFAPVQLSAWLQANSHAAAGDVDLMNAKNIDLNKNVNMRILLNPIGALRLAELPKPTGNIELLIGAEGGLSQSEIDTAISQGFQSIVLGPRILRTETAALTAITAIQTIWGDF